MESRKKTGQKSEKTKKISEDEYIFQTSENIDIYSTFDEMGLRDDLIKGT
jgi:hypothetical protein